LVLTSFFQPLSAAVRIGAESARTPPASARWSSIVNFRPGDREVVSNNPPTFQWMYNTNHILDNPNGFNGRQENWTNAFNLQVASNSTFTGNLQANVWTPVNTYSFLGPLDTNATRQFWWRVRYVRNGTAYWVNGPFTFTIADNAPNLDRSMFTNNSTYLRTNGTHPLFCFRAGEQPAIWQWMQTNADYAAVGGVGETAVKATNSAFWKSLTRLWSTNAQASNPNLTPPAEAQGFEQVRQIGCVLMHWALSGDPRWTNPNMTGYLVTNIDHFVKWYAHTNNLYTGLDYGMPAGSPEVPLLLAAAYDWMYDFLGTDTTTFNGQLRTNLYDAMWKSMQIYTHAQAFYTDSENGNYPSRFWADYKYPKTAESVPAHSFMKLPHSHHHVIYYTVAPMFIVVQQDAGLGEFSFNWFLNYMLSRTTPFAGFAAIHSGPYGYGDGHAFKQTFNNGIIGTMMFYDVAYPEAQVYRSEFAQRFPEWWTRMHPYRMRRYHGPWGDGAPIGEFGNSGFLGRRANGWDMAAVTRSGLSLQAYNLNSAFHGPGGTWTDLPLRWHYRDKMPAPETNTTSKLYEEDGYVIASSQSPSEFDCYTNGVGFTLVARPRGSTGGHNVYSDGSVDLWAYGAQLTDGGGNGLDPYGYTPEASPTLFVNGRGQNAPGYLESPLLPIAASICNFTNDGTDFVYAAADLTGLFTNSASTVSSIVTHVKRHVLFVRSKYWVIYDEFGTRSNATFGFRWHIPWLFRYQAGGSPLGSESIFRGGHWGTDTFGSNSYVRTANGFNYTAGNFIDSVYIGDVPRRIPVQVVFANPPNSYGIFEAKGLVNLEVTSANALGTSKTNSTLNPFVNGGQTYSTVNPDRAVGLWVTNRFATTNWHFMTVIVPQESGIATPTIASINDNTIAVTYDGVTETTTFSTNFVGATYTIDLARPSKPTQVGGIRGSGGDGIWGSNPNLGVIRVKPPDQVIQ
jgi:hypothetical protein